MRTSRPLRPPFRSGYVFALDPGINACGVSLWLDGELLRAAAVRAPATGPASGPARWAALACAVDLWVGPVVGVGVLETMKVYRTGRGPSQVDPEDLLNLAGVGGAVAALLGMRGWDLVGVKAGEWNGQVPADIRRGRSRDYVAAHGWGGRVDLATTERFQQDVWSAVGIGRWATTGDR